jgi:hypothetical protein
MLNSIDYKILIIRLRGNFLYLVQEDRPLFIAVWKIKIQAANFSCFLLQEFSSHYRAQSACEGRLNGILLNAYGRALPEATCDDRLRG